MNKKKTDPYTYKQDMREFNSSVELEQKYLVPCRWERSGWKYLKVDPKDHNSFFNNPNRKNLLGDESRSGSVDRISRSKAKCKKAETTYG